MLGPAVLKPLQYLGERGKRLLALCGFTSIAFRAVEGGPVMLRPSAALLLLLVSLALSFRFSGNAAPHKIPISDFAKTQDDNAVSRYVLVNQKGMEAVVITYGAALVSLKVANRSGRIQDLVLGRLVIDSVRKASGRGGVSHVRVKPRNSRGSMLLPNLHTPVLEANLDLVREGLVLSTFGHVSGLDRDEGLIGRGRT